MSKSEAFAKCHPGARSGRRVLCVFPRYTPSLGSFEFSYPLTDGVRAFMPPQGLLVIAAYMPRSWQVRFVDENLAPATPDDFEWADVVFVSGMHMQRSQMEDIRRRAHALDKVAVLGGSSVSACPQYYPDFDYLHVGELGDATDELIARLERDPSRPPRQVVFATNERRPLTEFPLPAYELAQITRYFIGSIQFSSGCPYQCEFCDIPALYGRNPRFKTPEQVTRRTRQDAGLRVEHRGLFRRRQFHRAQARRARASAAPRRMAAAQQIPIRVCLRGHA